MAATATLFDKKVREHAGSQTSARYQFQANVAILKLCEAHQLGAGPYYVLVDQFDDVVTIFPTDAGLVHHFYQVKAKESGVWTIGALTRKKRDAAAPASIVGKLYENAHTFPTETRSINFLSNAALSAKMKSGETVPAGTLRIHAKQLNDDELKKIEDCLESDFPSPRKPDCSDIFYFERTAMGLHEQPTFVTGRLCQLLESIGVSSHFPAKALYHTLFADISAKAASAGDYSSDAELLKAKAVSRDAVERTIEAAAAAPRFIELWPLAEPELREYGFKSVAMIRLKTACNSYIARRGSGHQDTVRLSNVTKAELADWVSDPNGQILDKAFEVAGSVSARLDVPTDITRPGALVEVLERLHAESI